MSWLDDLGDSVEHAASAVKKDVGQVANSALHGVADAARDIGWDSAAHGLDELGDHIVDVTGGAVTELELGETEDPQELVRGKPDKISEAAGQCKQMGDSIGQTGDALRKIDLAHWTGDTADEFRGEYDRMSKMWWVGADAMHAAATVLDGWFHEVSAAQVKASEAIAQYKHAKQVEHDAKDRWNRLSDEQKSKSPIADTWTTLYQAAQQTLNGARSQRDNAAATVVSGLAGPTNEAPKTPSFTSRLNADFTDANVAASTVGLHFTKGLVTSLAGVVQFARQINPMEPYNIAHPAQYMQGVTDLGTGMVVAAADPGATVSALWKQVKADPAEAAGALTGQVLLGVATGGAGEAGLAGTAAREAATAAKAAETAGTAARAAETAGTAARSAETAGTAARSAEAAATKTTSTAAETAGDTGRAAETAGTAAKPTVETPAPHPDTAAPHPDTPSPHTDLEPGGAHPESTASPEGVGAEAKPDAPHEGSSPESGVTHSGDPADPAPHTRPEPPQEAPTPGEHGPDSHAPEPHTSDDAAGHSPHDSPEHHPSTDSPDPPTQTDPSAGHEPPADHHPDHPHENLDPHERAEADHGAHDDATDHGAENNRDPNDTCAGRDPVDIATGEFLLPATDIDLPGVLPLRLERRHRSSYRYGRWFGPSWSCTLDMRIVVEEEGVTFLGEDGVMLAFPHARVGEYVDVLSGGARWSLTRSEMGTYQVRDKDRELVWHFAPEPGLASVESKLGNYAISAITDRHRNRIRFEYDDHGAPTAVAHSGGYRVWIGTDRGRVVRLAVTDRDASVTAREFVYTAGELTTVTNGVGGATVFTYDQGRMTSWTDSNGNRMVNTYDEAGRVIRQRGTGGILDTDFDYLEFPDGSGSLTTVTDSYGAVSTHGFDQDLRLRDFIDPVGGRTHTDYNSERRPKKVVAPDGAVTEYDYDRHGDVARITRPDGHAVTVTHASPRRPGLITDVDGSTRRQEWSPAGDLTATIDAAGARTEFRYHPNGAVLERTDALGGRTFSEVDGAGLPIAVTDSLGAVTCIERDGFGRPIRVTDALGHTTTFSWSAEGKLVRRLDPDGHREEWTYDAEGNLLTHTNRAGGTTTLTYQAFDLVATRTEPDGSTTSYLWDRERRLIGVVNPLGHRWSYEYDLAGRLTAETDYTGATTAYTHDQAGRRTTITPATGVTRRYAYDQLGRIVKVTADTGEYREFTHDLVGRTLTAESGAGDTPAHTLLNAYTAGGHLASQQIDDQNPLLYSYDQLGRRTSRTSPAGAITDWHYDPAGNATSISADGRHIGFTYDALGRPTGWRIGEVDVRKTYDPAGRVATQTVIGFPAQTLNLGMSSRPEQQTLRTDHYEYRPDGYLSTHTLTGPVESTTSHYQLDSIGRVTAIHDGRSLREEYAYDPLGNITRALPDTGTTAPPSGVGSYDDGRREYRNNLLVRAGRTRYHYDAAGRLIRKTTHHLSGKEDTWHYRYDAFDQLIDVWTPGQQWWTYTYDALSRRITKQRRLTDGTAIHRTDFIWDGNHLIEESAGETSTRWTYAPNSWIPVCQTRAAENGIGEVHAVIPDIAGTPAGLVQPDHVSQDAFSVARLWGGMRWIGESSTPLRLQGQYCDDETSLHYNLHRTYDPETGRYLTLDPLGLAPAPNPYGYPVNPTAWVDPLGLVPTGCEGDDERGHTYYRAMSEEHYEHLMKTGELPPTGETFISPTQGFSDAYDGRLVEFQLRPGTIDELAQIGVRNDAKAVRDLYPDMPPVSKGWALHHAHFKGEGYNHVNIGLGRGPGLEIFNRNIERFREILR
ncbi:putative T7SS-secreted protein [Nocardia nova]|uniref:putative T7SS-secreted protein n=1 Tax=Nocardia nova TaxID=37330 RepID=UPI0033C202C2